MNHLRARRLMFTGIGIGTLVMAISFFNAQPLHFYVQLIIGTGLVIAGIFVGMKYVKCPYCNGPLLTGWINSPSECPHCGKKLDTVER